MNESLELRLYSTSEAARLLEIPSQKLRRWLDGFRLKDTEYAPVIRDRKTGSGDVTWAEFVEAGFLREYRRRDIPLQQMRRFIEHMRTRFQVAYPLAEFKPVVDKSARELLLEVQKESELEERLYLVRWQNGQAVFAPVVEQFIEKIEFDPTGVAVRMWPLGKSGGSPVAIDPELAFGAPQVRGIRTASVFEDWATRSDPDVERIAKDWDLTPREVLAAVHWEARLVKAA